MATMAPPVDPFYVNMAKKRQMLKDRPVPPVSPPMLPPAVPPLGGKPPAPIGGLPPSPPIDAGLGLPGGNNALGGGVVGAGLGNNTGVVPPAGGKPLGGGGLPLPPVIQGGGTTMPPAPGVGTDLLGPPVLDAGMGQAPTPAMNDQEKRKGQRQFFARRQPQIAPPTAPPIFGGGAYT